MGPTRVEKVFLAQVNERVWEAHRDVAVIVDDQVNTSAFNDWHNCFGCSLDVTWRQGFCPKLNNIRAAIAKFVGKLDK